MIFSVNRLKRQLNTKKKMKKKADQLSFNTELGSVNNRVDAERQSCHKSCVATFAPTSVPSFADGTTRRPVTTGVKPA